MQNSPYGTFDQAGNVWEWNESIPKSANSVRGLRGGTFDHDGSMHATNGGGSWILGESPGKGFRVVWLSDCNGNGVVDTIDVDNGTSPDCQSNGRPDECESDSDTDGNIDDCDECPLDPAKVDPSICGCGNLDVDTDSDHDGTPDCRDECPDDPTWHVEPPCGCDSAANDNEGDDSDGLVNCFDGYPGVDDAVFAPDCTDAIPTVSQWGVVVTALLLMAVAKTHFGNRTRHQAGPR